MVIISIGRETNPFIDFLTVLGISCSLRSKNTPKPLFAAYEITSCPKALKPTLPIYTIQILLSKESIILLNDPILDSSTATIMGLDMMIKF